MVRRVQHSLFGLQVLADKNHYSPTPAMDRNPQWGEYMESFHLPTGPDSPQGLKG